MQNPLLWLALSLLLVAVSLTAVLAIAIPAIQELARAARSAERLLDMLRQELPSVLRSMQNTGEELSQLSDQVNEGVRSASQVVKQVDQGIDSVRHQAETTRRLGLSLFAGVRAAWSQLSLPSTELKTAQIEQLDDFSGPDVAESRDWQNGTTADPWDSERSIPQDEMSVADGEAAIAQTPKDAV